MKIDYDWTQENLDHLNNFNHFVDDFRLKPECKYNDECKAYIRTDKGENRLDDECHMKLYRHPPRRRKISLEAETHPLIINKRAAKNKEIFHPAMFRGGFEQQWLSKWKYKRLKTGAEIVSEALFQITHVKKEIRPIQNIRLHYNHAVMLILALTLYGPL